MSQTYNFGEYKTWVSGDTRLLGSKQDKIKVGKTHLFVWMVILDGHGIGNVINMMDGLDWGKLICENPDENDLLCAINKNITEYSNGKDRDNICDGTTCSIVKIYMHTGVIKCYTIGDSKVCVKINNNIYYTQNHDANNEEEMERIINEECITMEDTWKLCILDDNCSATMKRGKRFCHEYKDNSGILENLSFTRSLGHNRGKLFSTLQQFETLVLNFDPKKDNVTILGATDGLWDVMHENYINNILKYSEDYFKINNDINPVEYALNKTEELWLCDYKYYLPEEYNKKEPEITKIGNPDDIGIAIFGLFR